MITKVQRIPGKVKSGGCVEANTDFINLLVTALEEISEGKGRYNENQLIHASNTIEDMKELALKALTQLKEK